MMITGMSPPLSDLHAAAAAPIDWQYHCEPAGWGDGPAACGVASFVQEGYLHAALEEPRATQAAFDGMRRFFSLPAADKQSSRQEDVLDCGYRDLLPDKEIFMLRGDAVPLPLKPALRVWEQAHQLVQHTLQQLEQGLQLPPGRLSGLVDLPPTLAAPPTASLLRLLRYAPRSCGLAAAAHQDVGLLSYIPPSTASALQVLDLRSCRWHDVERPGTDEGVLMAGVTLAELSVGTYPACIHRVVGTPDPRLSMVFQARPRPNAWIDNPDPSHPSQPGLWGADLLARLRHGVPSINASCGQPG